MTEDEWAVLNTRIGTLAEELGDLIERHAKKYPMLPKAFRKAGTLDEPEIARRVRDICRDLLDAAEAEDLNGCPLCLS